MPTVGSEVNVSPPASIVSLPAFVNGAASGNQKCALPPPTWFGNGFVPKSLTDTAVALPPYQTASWDVSP